MGQKPDELEHQIEELRTETDAIVDELTRRADPSYLSRQATDRVSSVVRDAVSTVEQVGGRVSNQTDQIMNEAAANMPESIRERPYVVAGALGGLLMALSSYGVTLAILSRRRTPEEKARDRVQSTFNQAGEGLDRLGDRFGAAIEGFRQQAEDARRVRMETRREKPGMLKRVMWMAFVSGMATLGSMLFKRMSSRAWEGTMHEKPPKG